VKGIVLHAIAQVAATVAVEQSATAALTFRSFVAGIHEYVA
jgi:hypothetical protein